MKSLNFLKLSLLLLAQQHMTAQEIKSDVKIGPAFEGKGGILTTMYAYDEDGKGGVSVCRSDKRFVSHALTYVFEHFDKNLKLVKSYPLKIKDDETPIAVLIKDSIATAFWFKYDKDQGAYICIADQANVKDFKFSAKEILKITCKKEGKPFIYDINDRSKFTDSNKAQLFFSKDNSHIGILVKINQGDEDKKINEFYVLNSKFELVSKSSFKKDFKHKDPYEILDFDFKDGKAYILGMAPNHKRKGDTPENYYEITMLAGSETKTYNFGISEFFPNDIKMVLSADEIICAGVYKDIKKELQKGICFYRIDGKTLETKLSKSLPFTEEFFEKYGEKLKYINRFISKGLFVLGDDVFFDTEHYEEITYQTGLKGGGTTSYKFGDIITTKINKAGEIAWSKTIFRKYSSTLDEWDYLSHTSFKRNDGIYYFFNGKFWLTDEKKDSDNEEHGSKNFNLVKIDTNGNITFKSLLPDDESNRVNVSDKRVLPNANKVVFLKSNGGQRQIMKIKLLD